eukprot:2548638-Prymnesium_polylepis.1
MRRGEPGHAISSRVQSICANAARRWRARERRREDAGESDDPPDAGETHNSRPFKRALWRRRVLALVFCSGVRGIARHFCQAVVCCQALQAALVGKKQSAV